VPAQAAIRARVAANVLGFMAFLCFRAQCARLCVLMQYRHARRQLKRKQ